VIRFSLLPERVSEGRAAEIGERSYLRETLFLGGRITWHSDAEISVPPRPPCASPVCVPGSQRSAIFSKEVLSGPNVDADQIDWPPD
jgi:hypothetical protein